MTEREEQAITVLNTLYNNPLLSDIHRQALEVGIMAIKAASSSPQPKMGWWIILKDEYGDVTEAVCSNCDKNGNHKWAFCPKCGTKMQEVEE